MATAEVGTPGMLRAFNERRLVDLIASSGPISRAQIARDSGLSKPTVSLALSRLGEQGLVRTVGRTSGGRGATALLYDLEPTAGYGLAIDLGRRWVRAALVDISGAERARHTEHTQVQPADALIEQLGAVAHRLISEAGITASAVVAATLATPGVVPAGAGDHVELAPSLPGLGRHGVLDALRHALGAELRLENDVNAAAMAELTYGVGRHHPDFAYVSLGTGLGAALVLDGQLRRGASGSSGEIGYLPVTADDPPTALESLASADGLLRVARAAGLEAETAEDVVQAARAGTAAANDALDRLARALAVGIAAVCTVADPSLVVLGGGLGFGAADVLVPRLDRELRRVLPVPVEVVASETGEDAVLRGALATTLLTARDAVFGTPRPWRSA